MNVILSLYMLYIAYIDYKTGYIPDKVTFPGIALLFLYYVFFNPLHVLAALVGGGFFFILYQLSKGKWVGGGDVRLGFLIGLIIGLKFIWGWLILTYLLGGVVAGILLLLKKVNKKSQLPFAPFMVASALIFMWWGIEILLTYNQLLYG